MSKRTALLVAAILLLCLPLLVGCSSGEETTPDRVEGKGTIEWFEEQGGFYGIVADDGNKYRPVSLDSEFEQDGLRVSFRGTKHDLATFDWDDIELTYIEKI